METLAKVRLGVIKGYYEPQGTLGKVRSVASRLFAIEGLGTERDPAQQPFAFLAPIASESTPRNFPPVLLDLATAKAMMNSWLKKPTNETHNMLLVLFSDDNVGMEKWSLLRGFFAPYGINLSKEPDIEQLGTLKNMFYQVGSPYAVMQAAKTVNKEEAGRAVFAAELLVSAFAARFGISKADAWNQIDVILSLDEHMEHGERKFAVGGYTARVANVRSLLNRAMTIVTLNSVSPDIANPARSLFHELVHAYVPLMPYLFNKGELFNLEKAIAAKAAVSWLKERAAGGGQYFSGDIDTSNPNSMMDDWTVTGDNYTMVEVPYYEGERKGICEDA